MPPASPQARSGRAAARASGTTLEKEIARGRECSVVALMDALLARAYALGASDIHIDPTENAVRIRVRVDGVLHDTLPCVKSVHQELISRIKILTGLRTDEHQSAQDGRLRHVIGSGESIDVRVSIVPTYHGENAVLRLLTNQGRDYSLETLGFSEKDQRKLLQALARNSGMILSTGPTGSGKTTTLYTLISLLNVTDVSVVTIEDPIEYSIDGIEQIQVNQRSGLTFANGLRSILRQDPDIIMVGEIRDMETATIAVNTALTGHLLLSTLHTNNAAGAVPRLTDMGVDPYLLAATLELAIGQRLARRICDSCKRERAPEAAELVRLSEFPSSKLLTAGTTLFFGTGCEACDYTGYRGRLSIHEIFAVSPEIREAILRKASVDELRSLAIAQGMRTMLEDGLEKMCRGETTLEEVIRVVHE